MFNISFAEFIVILLLAFLIFGPNEMVKVARFLGKTVRKGRDLMYKIKEYVNEEAAESGLDEMKQIVSDVRETVDITSVDKEMKNNLIDKKEP